MEPRIEKRGSDAHQPTADQLASLMTEEFEILVPVA